MQVPSKDPGIALLALLAETVSMTKREHFNLVEHSSASPAEQIVVQPSDGTRHSENENPENYAE